MQRVRYWLGGPGKRRESACPLRGVEVIESRCLLASFPLAELTDDSLCFHNHAVPHGELRASLPVVDDKQDPQPGADDPREAEIPLLHSKPGAARTLYLDFDGHIVDNTAWNGFNNNLPIHAPPYSINSSIFSFNAAEIENIKQIHSRVAEDFYPFDVDVTTENPGEDKFRQGGQALRILVSTDVDEPAMGGTGNNWFGGAGGVAFLDSWHWTDGSPVWVFENNLDNGAPKYVGEAASHEAGHAFGLEHDGTTLGVEYYTGHGGSATGWAPIMGVGYNQLVTQWSRGEYLNANNGEDDIAIITSLLGNRADEHGNNKTNASAATPLTDLNGAITGTGAISLRSDVDVFRFTVPTDKRLQLQVNPTRFGPNLDILAEIYASDGTLSASSNPANSLFASFDMNLPAGTYTLAIDGIGLPGTPALGYTDYGSLGQYTIEGTLSDIDFFPGPHYVSGTPILNHPTSPTSLIVPFSEPIDASSLEILEDIELFLGGNNVTVLVESVSFPSASDLQLNFLTPLGQVHGTFELRIGPNILDMTGLAMDQDRDGIPGEIPGDVFTFSFNTAPGLRGDFNSDQLVNAVDIDLLCNAIRNGGTVAIFDLNQDLALDNLDMDTLIRDILMTQYGDANLDRIVDGTDFGIWNANKFTPGGWGSGDFSCDGIVDGSDFGIWNANKFTGGSLSLSPVNPEPLIRRTVRNRAI